MLAFKQVFSLQPAPSTGVCGEHVCFQPVPSGLIFGGYPPLSFKNTTADVF